LLATSVGSGEFTDFDNSFLFMNSCFAVELTFLSPSFVPICTESVRHLVLFWFISYGVVDLFGAATKLAEYLIW
jgi:hypothetical protein